MIFPVKPNYTTSPDIVKYDGPAFNLLTNQSYIIEKLKEISIMGSFLSSVNNHNIVKHLANYTQIKSNDITQIALRLEEDVAILNKGIIEAICFCFPSGFSPYKLLNKSFHEVHQVVPHNEKLLTAADNINKLISKESAKFRRYVWTITQVPSLSQHPIYKQNTPPIFDKLYFRTETQTTVGLGNDIALFFVKVDMTPLSQIWIDTDKQNLIKESLNSMSDEILTYKNLHQIKELLLNK
jgi:hypothetical protein